MSHHRLRVGIVGLQVGRSWAARAHVPALRSLVDDFEIVGVANSTFASAEAAAAATGIPRAFRSVDELVSSGDIDLVVVTVRVPRHREIVEAAIAAGKHVYCEWPLGNGLEEAESLAAAALRRGVLGFVGTQARVAPEVMHLRNLVSDGVIGDVLSTSLVATGGSWGGAIPDERSSGYMLDAANGATMLTIPMGHTLAAVQDVLGNIAKVAAVSATRRQSARVLDTGATLPMTAPDQVLVSGVLEQGSPISIHYRGGLPRDGNGLRWEIHGTQGDIRVGAPLGHLQLMPLTVEISEQDQKTFRPVDVPAALLGDFPKEPSVGNVARLYRRVAEVVRGEKSDAPTFDDGVALHRLIDAIERAASRGQTVLV